MDGLAPWQYVGLGILGVAGTIVVAWFALLGAKFTAAASREGATRASDVDAQDSALQAWHELLQPYRDEVAQLRGELRDERAARTDAETAAEDDRAEKAREVQAQMDRLTERIDLLTLQLGEWKRLAKTIARWATRLRDEVLRLGGEIPATPEELLTLQAIEDAEQL